MDLPGYRIEVAGNHARTEGVELKRTATVSDGAMNTGLVRLALVIDLWGMKITVTSKQLQKNLQIKDTLRLVSFKREAVCFLEVTNVL